MGDCVRDWPETERPRERLFQYGAETLSDSELLGIILRTGSKKHTAMDLARKLLGQYGGIRGLDAQPADVLCRENGIGLAKAAQMKAAFELAKRLVHKRKSDTIRIQSSEDAYEIVYLRMRDLNREEFRVLFLNSQNEVLAEKILFTGSLRESVVSAREIILNAVQYSAASVIFCHNHPSGNPTPSREDKRVTQKMVTACEFTDITVLDHIIVGRDSYFSFADQGLLEK